ncbi:MAG: hypothetical protein HXY24_02865, partial [Rubrivivax sp.]|nr:hypothetical protein [Rubrivivax sp.]
VGATQTINATILAAVELQPQVTVAYPFVHGQFFRELEFVSLLARVTRWSANPALYAEAASLATPLWLQWWQLQLPPGPWFDASKSFTALAFGHAVLARVRLAPVIPDDSDAMDPFVAAIRRIEQESGRMIQAQIRLLKDGANPLPPEQRERIVDAQQAVVDDAFGHFLGWLAGDSVPPPAGATTFAWPMPSADVATLFVRSMHAGTGAANPVAAASTARRDAAT